MRKSVTVWGLVLLQMCLSVLWSAWTWILTAPNLVLSTHPWYWQVQTYLWEHFYANRPLITYVYVVIIVGLFATFACSVKYFQLVSCRQFAVALLLIISPLLFSYNALSYDVFNYLFNAKMVIVYHDNPHINTALDYSDDDWTRFMHNTHTTAPYGYGWTAVSLLPYYLSGGKFLPNWLLLRLFNLVLLVATVALLAKLQLRVHGRVDYRKLWLFAGNPLVLIEIITNLHNDLWMMLPALASLYLLLPTSNRDRHQSWLPVTGSLGLMLFSLSIKYATVALLPVWIFLLGDYFPWWSQLSLPLSYQTYWRRGRDLVRTYLFDLAAGLMFLPLLTGRSQLFHPWYLVWSLCLIPLCQCQLWRRILLAFSFSSLLRYLPYLWENGYATQTLLYQQLITFTIPIVYLLAVGGLYWRQRRCHK